MNPDGHEGHCCHSSKVDASPSVRQTIDELDFERGLWAAARDGDMERVILLLSRNTDPNKRDNSGYTALHYASRNGHLDICKKLLAVNADPNILTYAGRSSCLHRASYCGHLDIVKLLLDNKADSLVADNDGQTALHKCWQNNHVEVARLLLLKCSDLEHMRDNRGRMALELANDETKRQLNRT